MFTVLHEHGDGNEKLKSFYKVIKPEFVPAGASPDGVPRLECNGPPIAPFPSDVFIGDLKGGRVFIMNDRGQTVAKFELDR